MMTVRALGKAQVCSQQKRRAFKWDALVSEALRHSARLSCSSVVLSQKLCQRKHGTGVDSLFAVPGVLWSRVFSAYRRIKEKSQLCFTLAFLD